MNTIRRHVPVLIALLVVLPTAACDLTVTDLNNAGLDDLTDDPTRATILTAAQGLMIGARRGYGEFNRYVSTLGVLGRESYIFDASDPRFFSELLQGPLDPGGASFGGGGHWADRYANIRAAHLVLEAVEGAGGRLTTEEADAVRGFARTIMALDFLLVVNTRGELGAPIDVNRDPTGEPAPIVGEAEVYGHILDLLDGAAAELARAGDGFPMRLSRGFDGFATPAAFLSFNRALAARVLVYRGDWSGALAALASSFLDDDPTQGLSGLERGVYHSYGSGSGDVVNGLFSRGDVLMVHPSVAAAARAGDRRLTRKTRPLSSPVGDPYGFVTADRVFTIYDGVDAPIPIIRNEEVLLLRAEARLATGELAGARADLNLVRTVSGGLDPVEATTWQAMSDEQRLDELLYDRRYSLLFEGGHRWIDARRHDRLGDLPNEHPTFRRFRYLPFPRSECDARSPAPEGCARVEGF